MYNGDNDIELSAVSMYFYSNIYELFNNTLFVGTTGIDVLLTKRNGRLCMNVSFYIRMYSDIELVTEGKYRYTSHCLYTGILFYAAFCRM